jgi:hypothetical protein
MHEYELPMFGRSEFCDGEKTKNDNVSFMLACRIKPSNPFLASISLVYNIFPRLLEYIVRSNFLPIPRLP